MAREFAWSFSKLNSYETCPKRYYEVDVARAYAESPNESMQWGDSVHKALAAAAVGAELPPTMKSFQKWIDEILGGDGEIFVEQKYAVSRNFEPRPWSGVPDIWYRGIADVVKVNGPVALARDYKTGKIKPNSVQLMLMAQCIFAHFPAVRKVRTEFIWLADDATTPEDYSRTDVADAWIALYPRVTALETANKTQSFPPKPGGLCKSYCPVTSCIHHGKSNR